MDITSHVLKSNSTTTKAYILSPFFRLSLALSDSFRFCQNSNRTNENVVRIGEDREVIDTSLAGARLLMEFRDIIKDLNPTLTHSKIESGIYVTDTKAKSDDIRSSFIDQKKGGSNLLN